jgi:hypothetical protein
VHPDPGLSKLAGTVDRNRVNAVRPVILWLVHQGGETSLITATHSGWISIDVEGYGANTAARVASLGPNASNDEEHIT